MMGHAMESLMPSVPSELFYAFHDWNSPVVKKAQRQAQGLVWDPWPVKHTVNNDVFTAAQALVRIHNARCIFCSHQVTLLPASGNHPFQQGGSADRGLYSLRSPCALPVKIHIWQTPGAKIMASKGLQTATLTAILASFGGLKDNVEAYDLCRHYRCWKSRSMSKEWLQLVPAHLHQTVHERWWAFNGFPFLLLPFELREMVVRMVIGPVIEPYRGTFEDYYPLRLDFGGQGLVCCRESKLSLASVNKQLYKEVMTTYHLYGTLSFWHERPLLWALQLFSKPSLMSPISRSNVPYIELNLDPKHLCSLFGVPRDFRVGHSVEPSFDNLSAHFQTCVNELRLRRVRVNLLPLRYYWSELGGDLAVCQKTLYLRIWAGIRVHLRHVPVVELEGHIDEKQRQAWMKELSLERQGIVPGLEELIEWQHSIWEQHSATVCYCEPKCVKWAP